MSEQELILDPEQFPDHNQSFFLSGPAGKIEAVADIPEQGENHEAVVIICHPNPSQGGTLRNKVVHILDRSLRELGVRTIRFNFRGVGDSEGSFDNGFGETEDLNSVADWVMRVRPQDELWLAGFSFGSWVTARAAQNLPVKQMVSIAPPVDMYDFSELSEITCPWLVVQGDEDEIVSAEAVKSWVNNLQPKPQLIMMTESGHFFHRRLMDLRGVIKNGIRRQHPDWS
ncbi:MAG: alpha/beta hydrolase [bacterium]